MANGQDSSQTDGSFEASGDLKEIFDFITIDNQAKIDNKILGLSEPTPLIGALKSQFPEYSGWNDRRFRFSLANNENGLLDQITDKSIEGFRKRNPALESRLTESGESLKSIRNRFKSTLKQNLLKGTVTGESIRSSIVKRSLELNKHGNYHNGSLSWKNNNPLNMMYTAMSDDLKQTLMNQGIDFKESPDQTKDGTLAKFASYEDGKRAAITAIKEKHGSKTVDEFLKTWSNNGYDSSILPKDKDYANKRVNDLSPEQLDILYNRMKRQEGWIKPDDPVFDDALPIEEYKEAIRKNPKRYEEFGILDEDGEFVIDNENLITNIKNDDKFHQKIIEDRYDSFEEVLDNEYNFLGDWLKNPSNKANAFSVYDKYGSEGLTDFLNLIQHEHLEDRSISDTQLEKAYKWYTKNKVGRDLRNFVGRGENRISFAPPKSALDTLTKIPKDWNSFAAPFYKFDRKNNSIDLKSQDEMIDYFLDEYPLIENFGARDTEVKTTDKGKEVEMDFYKIMFPDYKPSVTKKVVSEESLNEIKEELRNRKGSEIFDSSAYDFLTTNILNGEKKKNNSESLIKTLQANGVYKGDGKWSIQNFDEQPFHVKIAVDALNKDSQFGAMITPDGNGNIELNINRPSEIKSDADSLLSWFVDEETVPILTTDERGGLYYDTVTRPETGPIAQVWNTGVAASVGLVKGVGQYIMEPVLRRTKQAVEIADKDAGFVDTLEGILESRGMDALTNMGVPALAVEEDAGILPKVTSFAMPFVNYLGATLLYSRAAIGGMTGLAKGAANLTDKIKKIGAINKNFNAVNASKFIKGGKFTHVLDKWNKATKARETWTYSGNFYLGDVLLESQQPEQYSMSNYVAQGIDFAREEWMGQQSTLEEKYRAASGLGKLGVDALTSFGLASVFDNMLATGRWWKDGRRIKKGNPIISKYYDPLEGRYDVIKSKDRYWRNELNEFMSNLTKDLDKHAIGSHTETLVNSVQGRSIFKNRENIESITDFAELFMRDVDDLINDDLFNHLEGTTRHYVKMFGGELDENRISEIATQQYDRLIRQTAEGIYGMFKFANDVAPETLPLKFADALDNVAVRHKRLTDQGITTLEEANKLVDGRPNRYIQGIKDGYEVFEIRTNLWASDLANTIRKRAKAKSLDSQINADLKQKGLVGDDLTEQQALEVDEINQFWNDIYGQDVTIAIKEGEDVVRKRGHVIGKGREKGFKVISETGDEIDNVGLARAEGADEMDANTLSRMQTESEGTDNVLRVNYRQQKTVNDAQQAIRIAQQNIDRSFAKSIPKKIRDGGDLLRKTINHEKSKVEKFVPKVFDDEFRNTWGLSRTLLKPIKKFSETGRKSYELVENVIRNFGVDDDRVRNLVRVTRGGTEKRIIGKKNLTDITEWDREKAKSGIPKDVLVKRTNRNGYVGYYLSNKKTDLEPSRWVETDTGVRMNPDWDQVNVNQTLDKGSPVQFVQEEVDGKLLYRRPKGDETGDVFLNVQNAVNAEDLTKTLSPKEIVETGIDAFKRRINGTDYYEPISPADQVKSGEQIVNYESRDALRKRILSDEPTREEIMDTIEEAGIKGYILGPALGYLIGGMLEGEEPGELSQIGSLIGLFLGSRTVRAKIGGLINGKFSQNMDEFDKSFKGLKDNEKLYEQHRETKELFGSTYDVRDPEISKWEERVIKPYKNAISAGEDMNNWIRNNRYIQSSFTFLDKMGFSKQAQKLKNILLEVDRVPNEMKRDLTLRFNKRIRDLQNQGVIDESIDPDRAFHQIQDRATQFLKDYLDEAGMTREDFTDDNIWEMFNKARWRIMNSGARIKDGTFVRFTGEDKAFVDRLYGKDFNPNELNARERLDRAIVNDPFLGSLIEEQRNWYNGIRDRWLGALRDEMNFFGRGVFARNRNLAHKLMGHNGDLTDFKQKLDEDELKQFAQAKKSDDNFRRMLEIQSRFDKFNDLGRGYEPMILSKRKLQRARQEFFKRKDVVGLTDVEKRKAFREDLFDEFVELNGSKKLKAFSNLDGDIRDRSFTTKERARQEFLRLVNDAQTGLTKEQQDFLRNRDVQDDFIQKKEIIERDEDGNIIARSKFILEEPEDIAEEIGVFERANKVAYEEFFDGLMSSGIIRNSNHLEKPRKYVLPERMAETDFGIQLHKYTMDVGKRLHLVENGILDDETFNQRFVKSIEGDLKRKGYEDVASKHINRIRSIYRLQAGINHRITQASTVDEMRREMDKMSKRAKMSSMVRNFIGAAFQPGIAMYDIFQHAIMSPLLTSWGSWRKSFMMLAKDPQAVKRMNELGETLHYAEQRLHTFMPEIGRLENDFTSTDDLFEWFYDLSNKAIDFSSRFSITRGIGNFTGLYDLDNAGVSRLFFDNFYGVNQTATSVNALAHLIEADELARIARQFEAAGKPGRLEVDGKMYRYEDLRRQIRQVGIDDSDYLDFINKTEDLNNIIAYATGEGRNINITDFDDARNSFKYAEQVLQNATDTYHGRNKMFRPESWLTPFGRLAAQYSIYPFNFALQTTRRRILAPMQSWNDQFGHLMEDDVPFMKITYHMSRGEKGIQELKKLGLTQEAIDAIPINSFKTTAKMIPAIGIGIGMTMTRDAVQDMVAMAAGVQDFGEWEATKENFILNPYAPESEQVRISDLGKKWDMDIFGKFLGYSLGRAADLGAGGKVMQVAVNDAKFSNSGIMQLTPVGQLANDAIGLWKGTIGTGLQRGFDEVPRSAAQTLFEFGASRAPIIGSYSQLRSKTSELWFNKNDGLQIEGLTEDGISTEDLITIE